MREPTRLALKTCTTLITKYRRHRAPSEVSKNLELPAIKSPQIPKQVPLRRYIGSVDSIRRQEASRRLIELYKANPIRHPINVNVLDDKENGAVLGQHKRPPLPMKLDKIIIPQLKVHYMNPVKQAGRAILERPHYRILPQWWG